MSSSESGGEQFLDTIGKGFNVDGQSTLASLIVSVVLTIAIALLFCFLRPYNSVVYAPRAKYADDKHAPPPVAKGLLGWIPPLLRTKEKDLVEKVGLDAAVFMRVCRMLRNMFTVLAILGCGILIPNNLVGSKKSADKNFFNRLTPLYLYGSPGALWTYVVVAWIFDIVIIYFLWTNYRHVARLRREYFDSPEFQRSLHARTLMMTDIPKELRSDEGIARIIDEVKVAQGHPRTAIARNVKDLPDLVEDYEDTVKELEEHLAKYLKNPDKLPPTRPMCKVHKNDKGYGSQAKGQKVDAIEYLTARIKELEYQIREVRHSVDRRDALSYGFASYESIPAAHSIAYAARNKTPHGAALRLAPKPNDLVWKNLKMGRSQRKRQNMVNSFWIAVLTAAWTVPNLLIAVFLSNLNNLAALWPAFKTNFEANPTWWAIVQGVLAPALTMLFYFYLPAIFRKLCIKAGDTTKTSRERHVARSLYSFFFFNNLLVFSLFSTVFAWVVRLIRKEDSFGESQPFIVLLDGFCGVSTYWICWMLQRNLGAAVDLSQLFTLLWGSYSRRFLSPTPRSLIELSAPQAMDYAGYYNYFLFYSTVAITFATIQPLILPVTAFYFWMDSFMKKYLLLYVFITKYESGGMFWRSIYNRILFLTLFGNVIVALVIAANALTFLSAHWPKLACLVPLPVIIIAFKIYCRRAFDNEIHYYHMGRGVQDAEFHAGNEMKKSSKGDRMAVRFGHPVLYRPLITPMVSSKSQHLLRTIYTGRTSLDDTATMAGYSDVYMDNMDARKPGKGKPSNEPFELVDENNMDFENYKNRPEFRDEAGGDGELYGHAGDLVRPGTPSTAITGFSRAGTFDSSYSGHSRDDSGQSSFTYGNNHSRNISQQESAFARSRSESRESERTKVDENIYPRGYHRPTPSLLREQSPAGEVRPSHLARQESADMLVSGAAGMGSSTPAVLTPGGYGPVRYGTPDAGYDSDGDNISYDYIRRGRTYPNV